MCPMPGIELLIENEISPHVTSLYYVLLSVGMNQSYVSISPHLYNLGLDYFEILNSNRTGIRRA